MEQKKVTYTGVDTEDVTEQLEQGNAKLAEKGWLEEDEELPLDGEEE